MFGFFLHFFEWFRSATSGNGVLGLEALPEDKNDFEVGFLGWGRYKPKFKRTANLPSIVHDQKFNTCAFNSRTAAKELDEKEPLSVRFLVALGTNSGIVTGDGYTNLRAVESLVQKNGVCKYALVPDVDGSFLDYSDPNVLKIDTLSDAADHKSKSFWAIKDRYQAWKALDEGRTIRFGVRWRTSMQPGFIQSPYILDFKRGFALGGHAILVVGYDRDYSGEDVFVCQNSYGREYADKGRMYIRVEDFEREIKQFGAFCDLDIPKEEARGVIEKATL